ncbi:MAG: aminotransferase class V-fold PLP-dependent enzyme, partial [Saprospiraceae bacterium]|nr:aminotransferase class V-fold PLP-dependent enzyme [Saprospiraceae bacterium]
GGVYPSAIGDFLADVTNRYAGIYFANPGAVRMENMLIRWMCDMIGYPVEAHGNLTSGGSIANLIGITTARDALGIRAAHVPRCVIYVNAQTHHCVHKAIRIAGLAEATLRQVPLDEHFRMHPGRLEEMIAEDRAAGHIPFLVVASLGSTDTGAIDPVGALATISHANNMWLQVDAAYGGFFALVPEIAPLLKGAGRSDSYIVDPHKGLFLPYGTGAILVRDAAHLNASHYYRANYMQDAVNTSDEYSPADLSPELTKHFRGLRMWLPLQLFGLSPFRAALKEKWLLARYFHRKIGEAGFTVGPEPELSVAIYRYEASGLNANAFNAALVKAVQEDGRIFISSTMIDGVFWIRLAVLCFRTHLKQVDLLLELLIWHRDRLLAAGIARV